MLARMAVLTEADVLFELFLPMLCESRAQALERFKGTIEFEMTGPTPRVWNLKGGKRPWVNRGAVPDADVKVTISETLVKDLVLGRDPSLEQALTDGRLAISGKSKVLEAFDLTMADATGMLGTLLKRK
jgi:hypothetical protein